MSKIGFWGRPQAPGDRSPKPAEALRPETQARRDATPGSAGLVTAGLLGILLGNGITGLWVWSYIDAALAFDPYVSAGSAGPAAFGMVMSAAGVIVLLVGVYRALAALDFLTRRELTRLYTEARRTHGY